MAWKTTEFERETVYAEVWAEPVTTVAKRYGISDVGLRKICARLDIPLPPAGYWAKKRAGKVVRSIALPEASGTTVYTSTRWVDEDAENQREAVYEESEEVRRQREMEGHPEYVITFNDDPDRWHRYAAGTAKRLQKPYPLIKGLISPHGSPSLLVAVSPGEVTRSMRLMDAVLNAAEARGFKVASKPRFDLPQAHRDVVFEVLDETLYVSLTERVRQTERELTPEEVKQRKSDSRYWISDRWIYEPTGVLKLAIALDFRGQVRERFVDKGDSLLENQISDIMVALTATAVALKCERAAAKERARQAALDEQARHERQLVRETLLKALHSIEQLAGRWDRAQRLRGFASALEAGISSLAPGEAEHRVWQADWIRKRADWLDPLVLRGWQEVDAAGHCWHYDEAIRSYTELEGRSVDDVLGKSHSMENQ